MHHHVANTACLIFESALMDLREFMSAGQLSPAMVPTASLHMAQGVSFLHSHHIIHRDLKPNNFLVHVTLSGPVFQIADFGTATISSCPQAQGKLAEMTPGFAQTPAICFISGRQVMVFLTHRGLRAPQLCSPGPLPATDHRSHSSYPVCANPTQQFDILSLGRVPSSQFSDRVTRKVGTFTSHFSATHRTHNGTEVHGIRHQPNRILRQLGKQPATQHLPSLKSISPTGIVPTAWRMGNQTSESMVGSSFSFLQDCLVPSAGVGS